MNFICNKYKSITTNWKIIL